MDTSDPYISFDNEGYVTNVIIMQKGLQKIIT